MKKRMYIITGANGHLAGTIIRYLNREDCVIRGLLLPSENNCNTERITYFKGDVTKPESLEKIFSGIQDYDVTVIHAAGLVSIGNEMTPALYDVNVNGTRNIIALCRARAVRRLLYVSSVHAIDVRDVALGCISAAKNGRAGECYILSNRYIPIKDLLEYMRIAVNGRKKICFPLKLVKIAAPVFEWAGKVVKKRPLFTRYSLYTLNSNSRFSHDKATMQLGYLPRDIKDTVRDTILYLQTGKCSL